MTLDLTDHIELSSGSFLDLGSPSHESITLDDVAQGLSHTCRFAGQSRIFYSVAEHACLVRWKLSEMGLGNAVQWAGLHHDDAEAFVGDVSRPLKGLLPEYRELEQLVWSQINVALELGIPTIPTTDNPVVKEADNWALSAEAYYLLPSHGSSWFCSGLYDPRKKLPWRLGWLPQQAKFWWKNSVEELRP